MVNANSFSFSSLILDRNTPVCAGKTHSYSLNFGFLWKHPRVCGEDPITAGAAAPTTETPPCVRGRLSTLVTSQPFFRNTPVCAGKTNTLLALLAGTRKHPRVCGEDLPGKTCHSIQRETPPCVRGRPNR